MALELLSIYWTFHFWRCVSIISWKSENNNVHYSQQLLSKPHIFILRCLKYFHSLYLVERYWNKLLSKCAFEIDFWELNIIIFRLLLAWEKEEGMVLTNATILQLRFKEFKKIFIFQNLFQNILSHQILIKNVDFFS